MAASQPAAIGNIKPNDPAAWGYAARSPMAGKIWRTTPPSRADTSAAKPRFSVQIARRIRLGRVEPFSLPPDKTLPGTLHHSGIRPAPPSDHTPLARRSAFQRQCEQSRRGNSDAPAGLNACSESFLPCPGRSDAPIDVVIGDSRGLFSRLSPHLPGAQPGALIKSHIVALIITCNFRY
jgi:hypothetical protein